MRRTLIAVAALAVLFAACGGSDAGGVASLEESNDPEIAETETVDESFEESVLAFSACMRENGVEDFDDPNFNADGSLSFGGELRQSGADQETVQAAFQACQTHLEGIAFGRGSTDFTEIEDRLVEFAACMRDNGFDMPDPDFSNLGEGGGPGNAGPFGGAIDPEDPAFQSALESCEDIFEGFRIGGAGGPRGGGGGGGGG